jgi:ADP-heptose:LPS heptosyltransferase
MGDVVLQSALVAWLKFKFPHIKISFVTSIEFKGFVEGHEFIDHVITHSRKAGLDDIRELKSVANQIKALKPDFIIDLHNTLRAKLIRLYCMTTPSIAVYKRTFLRSILIWFKIDFLKKLKSHHERVIEDLAFLFSSPYERSQLEEFINIKNHGPSQTLTTIPLSFTIEVPRKYKGSYIVVSPVASFAAKRWGMDSYIELTKLILANNQFDSFKILILGGPDDHYCSSFNDIEKANERLINLQGQTSLQETNEILKYASLVVTNDTGVGHMTESLGGDVISIFGPTSPSFGFSTHRTNSKVIYAKTSCSPCSATGSRACSQKSHVCMEQIKPSQIMESIHKYFHGASISC